MRQLLWKEWHEQSWKLAFGCIVLSAIAVIGLHSRMTPDATLIQGICFLGAAMLPILSSTGLVPAERAEGSFESLLAMPIAPWRILLAKTAMGVLLCAGPLIVAAIVSVMMAGGREVLSGDIFSEFGRTVLTTISLFVWMMALTIRLPSEARAAMLALGILILWGMATAGLSFPSLRQTGLTVSPLVFSLPKPNDGWGDLPPVMADVIVQITVLPVVWLITVRLFVRPVEDQP